MSKKTVLISLLLLNYISSIYAEEIPTSNTINTPDEITIEVNNEEKTDENSESTTPTCACSQNIIEEKKANETSKSITPACAYPQNTVEEEKTDENLESTTPACACSQSITEEEKTEDTKSIKVNNEENIEVEDKQVAFALFTLVNNILRLEMYNADDLHENINKINSTMSDAHLIFSIDFTDQGPTPHSISWNKEQPGLIDIATSKRDNFKMKLESLFKDIGDDVIAICFDCEVANKNTNTDKNNTWEAHIDITFPIKIENAKTTFILDKKIEAACGFFMEKKYFENLIQVSGEITKNEALKNELISKNSQPIFTLKSITSKIKNGFSNIKKSIIAKFLIAKHFIGSSWHTYVTPVFIKK